jgi:tetratricopeptide (TPR) repeat protein
MNQQAFKCFRFDVRNVGHGLFDERQSFFEREQRLLAFTLGHRHDDTIKQLRRSLNDGSGAISAYRRGLDLLLYSGDVESIATHHKLILMLAEAGSYQAAADEAQRLIARAPADAIAYTLLGIADQAMNKFAAAKQAFTSALQLNPADENARQGLLQVEAQFPKGQ